MPSMDLSLLPSLLPHSLATLSNSDLTELPKSRCVSNNFVYQWSPRRILQTFLDRQESERPPLLVDVNDSKTSEGRRSFVHLR